VPYAHPHRKPYHVGVIAVCYADAVRSAGAEIEPEIPLHPEYPVDLAIMHPKIKPVLVADNALKRLKVFVLTKDVKDII
jgi:hypothetical protein